jgi:hypothetical protein
MESHVEKASLRPKALRISIQLHGDRLHLQATFPPKPISLNSDSLGAIVG